MQISLDNTVLLIETYKYLLLLPLAIFEGPIATIIGGFLSSIGILNPFLVYLVALAGDLIGDTTLYFIGRVSRHDRLSGIAHKLGFTMARFNKIESHFAKHPGKTLVLGKLAIGLEIITLVAGGAAKVPFRKFLFYTFAPTVPKSALWLLIGIYFGSAYVLIDKYLKDTGLAVILVAAAVVLVFISYRVINKYIFKRYISNN